MQSQSQFDPNNAALMLQQKFKSKSQLYAYLTQRLQVFLPDVDSCRMQFLMDIFAGKKDVVHNQNVPHFTVPSQPEVAVKIVFTSLIDDAELMRFFDTDRYLKAGKLPPKQFFWGVMFVVRKELTENLLCEVIDRKLHAQGQNLVKEPIQFSQVWAEKLLEYPAMQVGNSSRQTNLFQMMAKARAPAKRKPVEIPSSLKQHAAQLRPDRHINVQRRHPNVIRNEDDEEWKEGNME